MFLVFVCNCCTLAALSCQSSTKLFRLYISWWLFHLNDCREW
jgi:hypothetical protein